MQRKAVLVGEHRDGGLAHLVGRAQDAYRDLAAIGNQDFFANAHTVQSLLRSADRSCIPSMIPSSNADDWRVPHPLPVGRGRFLNVNPVNALRIPRET